MAVEFPWRLEPHRDSSWTIFRARHTLRPPGHVPGPCVRTCAGCFPGRRHTWLVGEAGRGGGEDGREYGANILQPEPQNCDPPRRALLEEKEKKKSNGFSGILFSMHI